MDRSSGSQFRGSRCQSAFSSGVLYTSTTTTPTPSSYEVVEFDINIASTHPPPRFHSSVVLIDCWKDCYKREEEEDVNDRQEGK